MSENEYEFAKKPRRMTDPPQNKSHNFFGYEGVEVKLELDPARIAYFTREATWGDVMHEPTTEEMEDTLKEIASGKVLGAAKEVPAFGFRIKASRSTMDQMLRLRESAGGAQTTRDNDHRHFNAIIPNTVLNVPDSLKDRTERLLDDMRELYGELVDAGVPPQDARYVALPLGFQTQWVQVMNLRALEKMCEQRLCNGLTQHETNYVVRLMRDAVVREFPWTAKMLVSSCEKRGACVSRSMLFPACGAFGSDGYNPEQFDADKHLYPTEQNDAQQFAQWDAERKDLERDDERSGITVIYSMAGEPRRIP